jgi:glucose-6-phosphate isomerase/transaldolase/glucose-6-phosphate isomerase
MADAAPGPIAGELSEALEELDRARIVERIWGKDHTVWSPDPTEISNRLGWLDLVAEPPQSDADIRDFVSAVRADGWRDAVLVGMGGSSLGAEALRASFGPQPDGLTLHVLDSIHPGWVRRVRQSVDPASTVFLVASKSGTTAEAMAVFRYFRGETEAAVGDAWGRHFVAITDPGTPLETLAAEHGFRAVFTNPPDIGGRFSVLSRFGRVPAALAGIDTVRLLDSGHAMAHLCRAPRAAVNPGAWLGAVLGAAANAGRDQLTLLTSARIASLGLWVEQLIAESTGKIGKGILPVTGEPDAASLDRHPRRLFVAVRYAPEPDAGLEARVARLRAAGQPVVELDLDDLDDLGGELFRWQFATAVAGHLIGVQPFDQPDVESAKRETRRLLAAWEETGELPAVSAPSDLAAALDAAEPTYVALMAYAYADPELEGAVEKLRLRLLAERGLTTTFGYGPRFLHSTGQLHKGGPAGGLFVQLLAPGESDLQIPGEKYGLRLLLQAQAAGDLAALQNAGRRCVRIDLGDDPAAGVRRLVEHEGWQCCRT